MAWLFVDSSKVVFLWFAEYRSLHMLSMWGEKKAERVPNYFSIVCWRTLVGIPLY